MDEIKQKIEQLFKEEDSRPKFTNTSELEEFSPEEKKEIEEHLRALSQNAPKKPKKIWKWHFYGIMLLIGLYYLLEFMALCLIIYLAIPYAINITWMTLGKAFTLTCLISLYRIWKNTSIFKFINNETH